MDFAIVDTFVRPDPAPYAANRADDGGSSSSFSNLLQEKIAKPSAGENRADAASAARAKSKAASAATDKAATDKAERNSIATASARPAEKAPEANSGQDNAKADATTADAPAKTGSEQTDADASADDNVDVDTPIEAAADVALQPPVLLPVLPSLPIAIEAQVAVVVAPAALVPVPEIDPAAGNREAGLTDALTAPTPTAPVSPLTPVAPEAKPAFPTLATPVAELPSASPAADDLAAGTVPVVSDTPIAATLADSPDTAAIAALAATPAIVSMVKADKTLAAAPVSPDSSTPVDEAILAGADVTAADVVVADNDDRPLPIRTDFVRLTPTGAGTVASAPTPAEAATTTLNAATSYAAQIAAQDMHAASAEDNAAASAAKAAAGNAKPDMPVLVTDTAMDAAAATQAQASASATHPAGTDTAGMRATPVTTETSLSPSSHANRSMAAYPVAEQIAVRLTKALSDNVDRIRIQLNPIELGHIDVRMEVGPDGRFNAVFAADRPQTVELLQRDARELARSLQDAGLNADMGSMSFNLRGEGQPGENAALLRALNETRDGPMADATLDTVSLSAATYAGTTTGNGRVDIRV